MTLRRNFASRLSAVGILAIAVALTYVSVMSPLLESYRREQASVELLGSQIEQYRLRARELPALREVFKKWSESDEPEVAYLSAKNKALAAAQILGQVKDAVQAAGGTLSSTNFSNSQGQETTNRISLRAQMTVTSAGLQRAFHKLESTAPSLFIDNVLVAVQGGQQINSRARKDSSAQPEPLLNVQFDVYGFYLEASKP